MEYHSFGGAVIFLFLQMPWIYWPACALGKVGMQIKVLKSLVCNYKIVFI